MSGEVGEKGTLIFTHPTVNFSSNKVVVINAL